jgi:tetratricopeptide (TPR) repeat protein
VIRVASTGICNFVSGIEHDDLAILCNRGLAYHSKNDFDRAIADYTEVIRLDRQDATAHYNRGLAKLKKGDAPGGNADMRLNPWIGR